MKNISIKLEETIVEQLDFLVKSGKYKSRNEALRNMIKNSIQRELQNFNINEINNEKINEFVNLFKKEKVSLITHSNKNAVELVNEGRER